MAKLLKKLKINEVSLVSRPAINKRFTLFKSVEDEKMVEEIKTIEERILDTPVETPAEVTEPTPEPVDKECPLKKKVCPTCGQEHSAGECPGKVTKSVEDLQKEVETEKLEKEALTKELAELRLLKEQVEKQAAIEKEMRITKEFIQKAATDMKFIPGVIAEGFGVVLKEASEKLAPETYKVIYDALSGASKVLGANNQLTKEIGTTADLSVGETPASQLDAIAKSMVMKSGEQLSYAEAYTKACMENPKIYGQHVAESKRV